MAMPRDAGIRALAAAQARGRGETKAEGDPLPPLAATAIDLDAISDLPPRRWLYGTMLVREFVTVLAASGGAGKTSLAIGMALAVASGRALLGEYVHARGKVWIYNLEDPRDEVLRRVRAAMLQHGIEGHEVADKLYVDSGRDRRLIIAVDQNGVTVATPDVAALIAEIKAKGICLLTVDPFVKCHSVEENSNPAADFVMTQFAEVAAATGCAILLLHHQKKGAVAGNAESMRGASAIVDAARAAFMLSAMSAEEAANLGINEKERRFLVRLDSDKANLAPRPENATWLKLESVAIGNSTPEFPNGDHVQAIARWTAPDVFTGLDDGMLNRALDKIKNGPSKGERYSSRPQDQDRYVGALLAKEFDAPPGKVKAVLAAWTKSGLLASASYYSEAQRKDRKGIVVDDAKRPGRNLDA